MAIPRRQRDGSWRVVVDGAPHSDGRRRQVTIRTATKAEAQRETRRVQDERDTALTALRSGETLGSYAQALLPEWRRDITEKTFIRYEGIVEGHIVPDPIAEVLLRDLSERDVREWVGRLWAKPGRKGPTLSPRSVAHCLKRMRTILKTAVERGEIDSNPAAKVPNPTVRRDPDAVQSWTVDEVGAFMDAVATSTSPNAEMWRNAAGLTLATGLRRGEILGLKWVDVDFATGTLTISRARTKPGLATSRPKTTSSSRTIHLASEAREYLCGLREGQAADRALLGSAWTDTSFVVVLPDGRPPSPDSVTRRFRRDCETFGIRYITWHGLRRTHATLALQARVPLHVVSRNLGHGNEAITLAAYAHVLPGATADAMDTACAYIFGGHRNRPE